MAEATAVYPFELLLPLAPYRFVWSRDAAVECRSRHTTLFTEELYVHRDGTEVVVRNYIADGSFHILSNRGEIRLIDNANNRHAPNPISVVLLP